MDKRQYKCFVVITLVLLVLVLELVDIIKPTGNVTSIIFIYIGI